MLGHGWDIMRYNDDFLEKETLFLNQSTIVYQLHHMSSRQHNLHLSSCQYGYRFFGWPCRFSSILRHSGFWRGPYRFAMLGANLSQECFYNPTVVFNHFERNSYHLIIIPDFCCFEPIFHGEILNVQKRSTRVCSCMFNV